MIKIKNPKIGEYVLVSKYRDHDYNDPWFISFFEKFEIINNTKYYIVEDSKRLWKNIFRITKNEADEIFKWEKDRKAEAEIAITSLNHRPVSIFKFQWSGGRKGVETGLKIIHPHQKPVDLYRWLLQNYAKPNDIILDTHVGSASSLIACHEEGYQYIACEKDEDYYKDSCKRLETHLSQGKLF